MLVRTLALSIGFSLLAGAWVTASPTPVPGGANQVSALSGTIGQTIFNGVLRIKVVELRDATPADHPEQELPGANQKVMVMTVLLRNGVHEDFIDLMQYTLADGDDISYSIPSSQLHPGNLHIQQGAAARQTAMFVVDKTYTPVKLLVQCASCSANMKFRNLRLTIPKPPSTGQ